MTDQPLTFAAATASSTPAPDGPAATTLGIGYRPARDDDLPLLVEIYAHTRYDELAVTGWPPETIRAFIDHQFSAQHRHYQTHYRDAAWLIIEREGEPVGRLYLAEWAAEMRIVDIALLPPARGAGIGGAILSDLTAWSEASGKPLSIHVERSNPARRLYQRHGFIHAADAGAHELLRRPVRTDQPR